MCVQWRWCVFATPGPTLTDGEQGSTHQGSKGEWVEEESCTDAVWSGSCIFHLKTLQSSLPVSLHMRQGWTCWQVPSSRQFVQKYPHPGACLQWQVLVVGKYFFVRSDQHYCRLCWWWGAFVYMLVGRGKASQMFVLMAELYEDGSYLNSWSWILQFVCSYRACIESVLYTAHINVGYGLCNKSYC